MAAPSARSAVAYMRVGAGSTAPPDAQERAIASWATREQVEVASWHVDVGVDGATPIAERPALMAAFQAVRLLGAGRLVAANATTFGHEQLVCWLIERAALVEGAKLFTADGSRTKDRSEPSGEHDAAYSRGAVELARAYQRVRTGARVRAVLAEKKARGERVGNVPYGFRLADDGIHLEPDAREQGVIATVQRLSSEGLSQRAIAARLAASEVVGRTGAPLRQTQIAKILRTA